MFSYRTWLLTGAGFVAVVAAITAAAGGIWFQRDRTGMLHSLCTAGLPNFSRPPIVRPNDLGCNILGPERRIKGILLSGFEASHFLTDQLGPEPRYTGFGGGTWFTCNQFKGCDYGVGAQVGRKTVNICGANAVTLVVEGWPTVSPERYGHLGMYRREFFMDRIVAAGPPAESFVRYYKARWEKGGFTEKDCQEMEKRQF
jgi:hypothetical protein